MIFLFSFKLTKCLISCIFHLKRKRRLFQMMHPVSQCWEAHTSVCFVPLQVQDEFSSRRRGCCSVRNCQVCHPHSGQWRQHHSALSSQRWVNAHKNLSLCFSSYLSLYLIHKSVQKWPTTSWLNLGICILMDNKFTNLISKFSKS